jgi:hypothetical protein
MVRRVTQDAFGWFNAVGVRAQESEVYSEAAEDLL